MQNGNIKSQLMQEEDCYWSAMEVKTHKNPKKVVSFKGVKSFLDFNAKDPVYSLACYFWPDEFSDIRAVEALNQVKTAKEICLYGRQSKILHSAELVLPPLIKLRLNEFCLQSIPYYVLKQTSLVHLNLSNNQIIEVPNEIAQLVNLKELHFYQNKISQFPLALTKIPNLWQLHINFNALSAIPEEIGQMKNLKDLAINYNSDIKDLPKVFWTGLKSLKQLAIVGTKFYENPANKQKIEDLKRRGIKMF